MLFINLPILWVCLDASTLFAGLLMMMKSETAVAALAALAQHSRLAIFRLLVQAGLDGVNAGRGRIGQELGLPPATLSFHLKELAHAGLIRSRQEGRFVSLQAQYDQINDLIGFLTEQRAACEGNPKDCRDVTLFGCEPKSATRNKPSLPPRPLERQRSTGRAAIRLPTLATRLWMLLASARRLVVWTPPCAPDRG
ncbi:ArsR/SmtB family transcription factor [Cupriavidus basilensis]